VLVTVDSYAEAQSTVNRLAHAGFDVSMVAIVGRDLVTIERVTGRLTYARVAFRGALNGSWFGLFFSLIMTTLGGGTDSTALPAVIAIGAGIGMLLSLATYSFRRRQHDFSSVQQVVASRYEVLVAQGTVESARQKLESAPAESN
jgi:hypothetical protein